MNFRPTSGQTFGEKKFLERTAVKFQGHFWGVVLIFDFMFWSKSPKSPKNTLLSLKRQNRTQLLYWSASKIYKKIGLYVGFIKSYKTPYQKWYPDDISRSSLIQNDKNRDHYQYSQSLIIYKWSPINLYKLLHICKRNIFPWNFKLRWWWAQRNIFEYQSKLMWWNFFKNRFNDHGPSITPGLAILLINLPQLFQNPAKFRPLSKPHGPWPARVGGQGTYTAVRP